MPISKLGQRRQVVIPKEICDELRLQEGDFVQVKSRNGAVIIKPKRLVDPDDILTPQEEKAVRKGEARLRQGAYTTLKELARDLDRPTLKRRRKTT